MRHTTTGVLLTKVEVLEKLEKRYAAIATSPWRGDRSHKAAIQRTLDALEHPHSHYVTLSVSEREQVRLQWLSLAKQIGVRIVQRRRKLRITPSLPSEVLAFFGDAECIPHFPRATDDYARGMRSMSWGQAKMCQSVELNPPDQLHWLQFDCDHADPERWKTVGLPEPSFITINPRNNHHHVAYRLKAPVCRSERGRARPLAFLRAVQEGLRLALNADPCYVGVLTKNPLHPTWRVVRPTEMPCYSLADLAATGVRQSIRKSNAPLPRMQAQVNLAEVGVGSRNRALFDVVRQWAWQNRDSLASILGYAERCNAQLAQPLGASEVKGIVTSIERYMVDLGRARDKDKAFRNRQAARGRLGGRPETTLTSQPWVAAGVCRSTWYRWQQTENVYPSLLPRKVGRPSTTKDCKPWLAAGISRATWYRQRQAAGEGA